MKAAFASGLFTLVGCSGSAPAAQPAAPSPAAAVESPAPPARDSLVLTAADGSQIWFTEGRIGHDSAGGTCSERSVEIRRGERRTRVPLLYTGKAPVPVGPKAIEAELWLDCRPMSRYRVDLETGRPTKVGSR
jgi:hypothetical protein